jgi:hypothetical protein
LYPEVGKILKEARQPALKEKNLEQSNYPGALGKKRSRREPPLG